MNTIQSTAVFIEDVQQSIQKTRGNIVTHPLYGKIKTAAQLRIFMEFHVYAVWDFMSLLKTLQHRLTCTEAPWFPKGNANTRYLINEIVTGEESDVDHKGVRMSHFEMYLQAMKMAGADTSPILTFCKTLSETNNLETAFDAADTPAEARDFVNFTFNVIASEKTYLQAAVFTFGREDLIPEMFLSFVRSLEKDMGESIASFIYYMERHIEVDGGLHSLLALEMTRQLCQENDADSEEVKTLVEEALLRRIALWNGVLRKIESPTPVN